MAHNSSIVGMPSQMRNSSVPNPGCGRMSHQTSRMLRIVPAPIKVRMNLWNWPQLSSWYGSPAVGSDSNTFERTEARPVSRPCQNGDEDDSAKKCGMNVDRLLEIAIASSPE